MKDEDHTLEQFEEDSKKHMLILTKLSGSVDLKELASVLLAKVKMTKYQIKCLMADMPRVICSCESKAIAMELADELKKFGCSIDIEPLLAEYAFAVDIPEVQYKKIKKEASRVLRSKVSFAFIYVRIKNQDPTQIIPTLMGPLGKKFRDFFRESDSFYPLNDNSFILIGFCTGVDGIETLCNKLLLTLINLLGKKVTITIGHKIFPDQVRSMADMFSGAINNTKDVDGNTYTGLLDESFLNKKVNQAKDKTKHIVSVIQVYFNKARGRHFKRLLSIEKRELWAGLSTLPKARQEAFIYRLPFNFPLASTMEQIVQTQPKSDLYDPSVMGRLEELIFSMNIEDTLTNRYKNQESILVKLNKADALPVLPAVAQKIIGIVSDPDSSIESLTQVIETDSTLTLKILKIVNSAFFGYSQKIDNVKESILILGSEEILNLALGLVVAKRLESMELEGCINPDTLWHHSLGSALIAKHLCGMVPRLRDRAAFTSGLLHDFGKIFMIEHFPEMYRRIHLDALKYELPLYEVEEDLCNVNHAKIGELIAAKWNLPHELVLSIAKHHHFFKKDQATSFSAIICLADFLYHMTECSGKIDVASNLSYQLTYGHYSALSQMFKPFNEEVLQIMTDEAAQILDENRDLFLAM